MELYSLYFTTIIVLACTASSPVRSQRIIRQQEYQYCVTPENYYGSCVTLSYCPQIANVYQSLNRGQARQYILAAQRSCGIQSIDGDPVVCCTNPRNVRQTTPPPRNPNGRPVTRAPANPFLPPQGPNNNNNNNNNNNPFLNPVTEEPLPVPPPSSTTTTTTTTTTATTSAPKPTTAPSIDARGISCRGPDNREGACIPLIQCTELANQLQIRQSDTAFLNYLRTSNKLCGGAQTDVCCPTKVQAVSQRPLLRNTDEVPRSLPTVADGCGFTTKSFKKIVGGEVSEKGSWPWITLIGYDDDLSASPFKCGGALITARHVVTAAHCMRKDLSFVRLGEHDLTTDTEARHVDIKVVRTEKHPNYTPRNGHSDIAILYLERNVQFTDFIAPICLPTTPELRSKSYVKYSPFVTGWGKTMEGGKSANVLQELQIPIYDNAVCRDRYQKQNRLFTENQFDAAVICAGVLSGGKDTCQGDSGGPLMLPEPYQGSARYYLIGVVSYGIGCARPDIPGVYSSTQYFIDWIIEKVADTQ